ncbi:MAG: insulinase family protein, partial [Verrucomicrobiota bacterium]
REEVAIERNFYEDAAREAATRQSRDLADQISESIGKRTVFSSPSQNLALVVPHLEAVTPEDCLDALREIWVEPDETLLFVSGNAEIQDPDSAIRSTFDVSRSVPVAAPQDQSLTPFAYADVAEPGPITDQDFIEDLDVTQIRFANQVRANFKPTEFEDETIRIHARIGAGRITEPSPGLNYFADDMLNRGGLGVHSEDDLLRIFAGQEVSVNLYVDDDAFVMSGETNPDDLLPMLQLMQAYLVDPGFRPEARIEFLRSLDDLYHEIDHTPEGIIWDRVESFLHREDSRVGYPDRKAMERFEIEDAKEWVLPEFKRGYLELSVVGDFDLDSAIALVASTFGTLPERDRVKPAYLAEREVDLPDPGTTVFEFESDIAKAIVDLHWPGEAIYEIDKSRGLVLLSSILSDRLRVEIREKLGDAYSPYASNHASDVWSDYGYLYASVTTDPDKALEVVAAVREIAAEMASGTSITQDELERARNPLLVEFEESRRSNQYWLHNVLEASQEYPQRLDWARSFIERYEAFSLEEINALAKTYLEPERAIVTIATPTQED